MTVEELVRALSALPPYLPVRMIDLGDEPDETGSVSVDRVVHEAHYVLLDWGPK